MKHNYFKKANGEKIFNLLSKEGKKAFLQIDPLTVYASTDDNNAIIDLDGAVKAEGLTIAELEELLKSYVN